MSPRTLSPLSVRCALLAAVVTLLAAARVAIAQPTPGPPDAARATDWVGLELSGLSLNLGNPNDHFPDASPPQRYSLAPGALLRLFQQRWTSWYWTPVQLGGVFGRHLSPGDSTGARTLMLAVQTEAGRIVSWGGHTRVELGLAAGLGGLGIEFSFHCDRSCEIGGGGVMVSPVVKVVRRAAAGDVAVSGGLFARAQLPLQANNFGGENGGYGVLFLFGVDLAIGRRQ